MLRMMLPTQEQQPSVVITGYLQYNYPVGDSSQLNPQQPDSIAHSDLNQDQTQDVQSFYTGLKEPVS